MGLTFKRSPKSTLTFKGAKKVHLFLHITLPRRHDGREKPRQPIELGGLDPGRPKGGLFVAQEDMSLVELYGPGEFLSSEIAFFADALTFEASRARGRFAEKAVERVGYADGRGGGGWWVSVQG